MPGAAPHYPLEFKREAVRLVRSSDRSIPQIAKELGVSDNSLRSWVKQGYRPGRARRAHHRRTPGAKEAAQGKQDPSSGAGDLAKT